ncbi:MAG TPA: ATP-binding protein [Rhizomicrobium sp.]|nr:ATP-binding protein [Rhizomicrobium sp.]
MQDSRSFSGWTMGVSAGAWRWAALGFGLLALATAGLALVYPDKAGFAGYALLGGIGAVAALLLYAVWPREGFKILEVKRVAEAAARANVAWAITGPDGAVADCNPVYRLMAGTGEGESPAPPELALAGEPSSAVLYRLARDAAEGRAREESFQVMPGLELVAAVRPLKDQQTVWWFTPRLSASVAPIHLTPPAPLQPAPVTKPAMASETRPIQTMSALFHDAPIGAAFIDGQGVIREANAAFVRFFGLSGSLAGREVTQLAEADDRAQLRDLVTRSAKGENIGRPVELRLGESRMAELFASPVLDGALLYLMDVSEQKKLETQFAQSQKMQAVGQLAGGVAHDFNNLLTVIIGNCEFLLMRHPAGDPSFKEINEVHQNALRAATLVGQLLAFSRKQTMQPKVLALGDMLSELTQMLRRLLREGIGLKLDNGADLWPVHADEAQLSNAIINLVVNARDAMPNGGVVSISTSNDTVTRAVSLGTAIMPPGDYVKIEVSDTGTGISKEHMGKIFDPFFTTKPVGQGTGLGLATVYGIVKQSGGFITLTSDVGRGTSFKVYLPRHRAEANVQVEAQPLAPRDVTGQDTILLVEDEEAVRSFAARALRLRGYHVLEASGGEEALEFVTKGQHEIALLITDVVMPNMDGPTLVRHVKELKPDLAVIFMSGYAEEAFRRNEENASDLHFLPKPFGLKQLAAKVKEVLSHVPARKAG